MAQVVSRQPLIRGFRVQSQASEFGSSGGRCGAGTGISPSILVSSCQCHSTNSPCPVLYHRRYIQSLARPGMKQATAIEDFEFHISYL